MEETAQWRLSCARVERACYRGKFCTVGKQESSCREAEVVVDNGLGGFQRRSNWVVDVVMSFGVPVCRSVSFVRYCGAIFCHP